jgi:lariat debranching enzyme
MGVEDRNKDISKADDIWAHLPASVSQTLPQPRARPGQQVPEEITNTVVRFLALDKCLPGQEFLQLLELHPVQRQGSDCGPEQSACLESISSARFKLQHDPEWLAITRVFSQFVSVGDPTAQTPPDLGESHYLPLIEVERKWVDENIVQSGKLDIPENFGVTAAIHIDGQPELSTEQPDEYTNPQTEVFCALAGGGEPMGCE